MTARIYRSLYMLSLNNPAPYGISFSDQLSRDRLRRVSNNGLRLCTLCALWCGLCVMKKVGIIPCLPASQPASVRQCTWT